MKSSIQGRATAAKTNLASIGLMSMTSNKPTQKYIPSRGQSLQNKAQNIQQMQQRNEKEKHRPNEVWIKKNGDNLIFYIMMNDERKFMHTFKQFTLFPELMNELAVKCRTPTQENVLHMAILKYFQNPLYLSQILLTDFPLYIENQNGFPPLFLLSSYTDDMLFQKLLSEFVIFRQNDLNLNYVSTKTHKTILHHVLIKGPSLFKFNLILQHGFDVKLFPGIVDQVIEILNLHPKMELEEKQKIIIKIMNIVSVTRKKMFFRVYESFKQRLKPRGLEKIGKLPIGIVREIAKYV